MSWLEIIMCFVVFVIISLLMLKFTTKALTHLYENGLIFFPGLMFANFVSYIISKPGDRLINQDHIWLRTDLPIHIGFPFSYFELGAWHADFSFFPFIINLLIVYIIGRLLHLHRLSSCSSKVL